MNKRKKIIVSAIIIVVLAIGSYFIYEHFTYVSTDDAQVDAHFLMLSARVSGAVMKVSAAEHQKVKAGEVLAEIDPSDYANALDSASAQVASLEARFREAQVNFQRATDLFKTQAISREKFDAAQANDRELEGRLKAARSQLNQANLNLQYTKILAPSDGIIARKSVEPGQYVPIGQPLFGFVASDLRWITANFKETDLAKISLGEKAHIVIDAIPGKSFSGEVESISPSTGAIFSLLPPDNATGNFTKVVQRVPVRIRLLNINAEDLRKLQIGLSADVAVRIR